MRAFLIVSCLVMFTTGCVSTPETSDPPTAEVTQEVGGEVTCWTKVLKVGKAGGIALAPLWIAVDIGLAVVNYKTAQLCRQNMGVCHGLCKVLGEIAEAGGQATYTLTKVEKKCDGAALSCKCKFKRTPIPQDDDDKAPEVVEEELAPAEVEPDVDDFSDAFPFSLPFPAPASSCTPSYSDLYPCADDPDSVCVDETSCCPTTF
ncbi:MAG: hypothetical protein ACKV2T_18355 [Kofleriaceae bacterium]